MIVNGTDWCAECFDWTNHTTKMHLDAMRVMCHACDEVEVQDEDQLCGECVSEQASYYSPDNERNN